MTLFAGRKNFRPDPWREISVPRDPDHKALEEDESACEAETDRTSWFPSFCVSFWDDPAEIVCD